MSSRRVKKKKQDVGNIIESNKTSSSHPLNLGDDNIENDNTSSLPFHGSGKEAQERTSFSLKHLRVGNQTTESQLVECVINVQTPSSKEHTTPIIDKNNNNNDNGGDIDVDSGVVAKMKLKRFTFRKK